MDVFIVDAKDERGVWSRYFLTVEEAHAFIATQDDMPGHPAQYVYRLRPNS